MSITVQVDGLTGPTTYTVQPGTSSYQSAAVYGDAYDAIYEAVAVGGRVVLRLGSSIAGTWTGRGVGWQDEAAGLALARQVRQAIRAAQRGQKLSTTP